MTARPTILALDLARKTGWALCRAGKIEASGVLDLGAVRDGRPDGHNGHMFAELQARLQAWWDLQGVTCFAYERASHRGNAATKIGVGLSSVVLLAGALYGVRVMDVAASSLKKWATGHGFASKDAMRARASLIAGRPIESDDEGDALCVAAWCQAQLSQESP